jgi:hypothetical protein
MPQKRMPRDHRYSDPVSNRERSRGHFGQALKRPKVSIVLDQKEFDYIADLAVSRKTSFNAIARQLIRLGIKRRK